MVIKSLVASEEAQNGFYPTPPALSEKLLSGINWEVVENVLEPQAGKGNIVRAVMQKYITLCDYGDRRLTVDCVEIDPYLRSILQYEFCGQRERELNNRLCQLKKKREYNSQTQCYGELTAEEAAEFRELSQENKILKRLSLHIVHDNFFTFQSRKYYNLIAMNPPFADGDAHLLKAIEIQCHSGGMIRCILNAETVRNPCTNRRRLLARKLAELEAKIEYVEGAFFDGERSTDVEVVLIAIDIPRPKQENTIFDRLRRAAEVEQPISEDVTDLTIADFIGQIVSHFNTEADAGLGLIREYEAMKPYIENSFERSQSNYPMLMLFVGDPDCPIKDSAINPNKYLRLVRTKYWEALFSNKKIMGNAHLHNSQDPHPQII